MENLAPSRAVLVLHHVAWNQGPTNETVIVPNFFEFGREFAWVKTLQLASCALAGGVVLVLRDLERL
jgi:hypothetical protein